MIPTTQHRPPVRPPRFLLLCLWATEDRIRIVGELLPQLYLHGLVLEAFEFALRGLSDEGASLFPASLQDGDEIGCERRPRALQEFWPELSGQRELTAVRRCRI